MGTNCASPIVSTQAEMLLRTFVTGERGYALRAEMARRHPRRSREEIDDAVQTACERFVGYAAEISDPAEVYAWIRTTAHRLLIREDDRRRREVPVDPMGGGLDSKPSSDPGPVEELIGREDDDDMAALVRQVADSLSERRRDVLALYADGYNRPQIAERLGLSDRAVKRDLLEIMDEARAVLTDRVGGGCEGGEPLVLRYVYGLASAAEIAQAKLHLDRCHRCEGFYDQLLAWREKAAAVLPAAPAIEAASPGALERIGQKVAHAADSAKQQLLGGGVQAKQQAASLYSRAVDPTPLAGVRPGAVAAVLASCITIGGGAAAYCANNGVDPIGAATGLIAGSDEGPSETSPPPSPEPKEPQPAAVPTYEVAPPTETSAEEEAQPAPTESQPQPEPHEETTTSSESAPPPPPEQTFEPASPEYTATETETAAPATEEASSESPEPAPVPAHSAPEFGGP
jgi:RNA polymerase sigma factor (sigma-70 family)